MRYYQIESLLLIYNFETPCSNFDNAYAVVCAGASSTLMAWVPVVPPVKLPKEARREERRLLLVP